MSGDSTYVILPTIDSLLSSKDTTTYLRKLTCESIGEDKGSEKNFFSTDLFANLVSAGALLITLLIFICQTFYI